MRIVYNNKTFYGVIITDAGQKIPKTYRSLSGESPSRKIGRSAAFESSLERDLLALVEFDPNVVHYEEQPVKIDYLSAGLKSRSYTPDILIIYKNETVSPYGKTHVLGEVKYRTELFKKLEKIKAEIQSGAKIMPGTRLEIQYFHGNRDSHPVS